MKTNVKNILISLIFIGVILTTMAAFLITSAFYGERKTGDGSVIFDKGIEIGIENGFVDTLSKEMEMPLQYYPGQLTSNPKKDFALNFSEDSTSGTQYYIANPSIVTGAESEPYYLRLKLNCEYYVSGSSNPTTFAMSASDKETLFNLFFTDAHYSPVLFNDHFAADATGEYYYYVSGGYGVATQNNLAQVTANSSIPLFKEWTSNGTPISKVDFKPFGDSIPGNISSISFSLILQITADKADWELPDVKLVTADEITVSDGVITAINVSETTYGLPGYIGGEAITGIYSETSLDSDAVKVFFPATMIKVGGYYGTSSLTNVYLGNNVETITYNAFGNTKLSGHLILPKSLIAVDEKAYQNVLTLTGKLTFPYDINSIGAEAFRSCAGLSGELVLPEGVVVVDYAAFAGCTGFSGVLNLENVKTIGNDAFNSCTGFNGALTLSTNLTSIGDSAFAGCINLQGPLTIPSEVDSIGEAAFSGCSNFKTVIIDSADIAGLASSNSNLLTYAEEVYVKGESTTVGAHITDSFIETSSDKANYRRFAKGYEITWDATSDTYTVLDANNWNFGSDTAKYYSFNGATVVSKVGMGGKNLYDLPIASAIGLTFNGWYSATSGGVKVVNADGTWANNATGFTGANGEWLKDSATTLYAQWEPLPAYFNSDWKNLLATDINGAATGITTTNIKTIEFTRAMPTNGSYNAANYILVGAVGRGSAAADKVVNSSVIAYYYKDGENLYHLAIVSPTGAEIYAPTSCSNLFKDCTALTTIEFNSFNTTSVTRMNSMFAASYPSQMALTTITGLSNWDVSSVANMSDMFSYCKDLTSLEGLSGWDVSSVTNMNFMFNGCKLLTSVGNLSGWDVSSVTTVLCMFQKCASLTSLNLSAWNVSSVTNMGNMFYYCNALTSVGDLSDWDVSSVTSMNFMFSGCTSLTSLDLSGWELSVVTDTTNVLNGCIGLVEIKAPKSIAAGKTLSLPSITGKSWYVTTDTSAAVTEIGNNTTPVTLGKTLKAGVVVTFNANGGTVSPTSAVVVSGESITLPTATRTGYSFNGWYTAATGGTKVGNAGATYTTSTAKTLYAQWTDITAPSAPIITRDDYNTFSWTATDNEAVTHYAVTNSATAPTSGWTSGGATGSYTISASANTWYVWVKDAAGNTNKASIASFQVNRTQGTGTTLTTKYENSTGTEFTDATVYVLNGTKIYISVTASTGYSAAITVNGSAFTSGNTRTIYATTNIASAGTALPSYFNSNWQNLLATDVNGAATGITKETIKTIEFTTAMPTDESYNANNYILVGAVGRGIIPTDKVVNSSVIAYYYKDGDNLYHLAIVSPTGSEIYAPTRCNNLFNDCTALTTIEFNSFNTTGVTTMYRMFGATSPLQMALTTITGLSNWDVSSVTNMGYMFSGCNALTSFEGLSGWNVSSVTDMGSMFQNCSSITSLDLSDWDVSSVTDMGSMFQNCSSITSLDLSDWDVSSVTDIMTMFSGCELLTSLDLTAWDVSSVTEMRFMFRYCYALTSLDLSGWNLTAVTNTAGVFSSCSNLVEIKAPKSIAAGKTLSLPTGKNWYVTTDTSAAVTEIGNDTTPVTLGKTLKVGVVVTFNANGGTVSPTSAVVLNGESITLPTPIRVGYSFNGWYTEATGGTKAGDAGATYTTSTATTLYAQWTDITAPEITITRTDYNTFSWTATDNEGVTHYAVSPGHQPYWEWISGGSTGSYDISYASTWYVRVKDAAGNTARASIASYQVNRTQGTGTTLTTKYESSTGTEFTDATVYVLNGTPIYIEVAALTGYSAAITVNGSAFTSGNAYTISATTNIASVGTDIAVPTVTISRTDYNTFSWTATDNEAVTHYAVTNSATAPTSGWISGGASGSYDISSANTWYVWVKDAAGNTNKASIASFQVNRTQGTGTTLTTKYENSTGTEFTDATVYVLNGTPIYIEVAALTGYSAAITVNGNAHISGTTHAVSATTNIASVGTALPAYFNLTWKNLLATDINGTETGITAATIKTIEFTRAMPTGESYNAANYILVGAVGRGSAASDKVVNSSVIAYYYKDGDNLYHLAIVSPTGAEIYAPISCQFLFSNCSALTTIEFNSFNTTSVTSMNSMFAASYPSQMALTTITGLSNWDVSSVKNMSHMFRDCSALTSVGDLSNWNVSSVTNMGAMFNGCKLLTSVEGLSNWNVSSVTDIGGMFSGCNKLTSIGDLSDWKVASVTDMSSMFQNCSSLTSLDLSGWDVSSVTNMGYMFNGCSSLDSLDLNDWDVSSVTTVSCMFQSCSSLTSLDLSGWGLTAVANTSSIFFECNKLVEIKAPKSIAAGMTLSLPTGKNWYVTTDTSAAVTEIGNDTTPVTLGKTIKVGVVVTFNANGGTVSPTSAVVFNGESITLPTATRTGYSINGWYTAATGGTKVGNAGATYTTSTAKTLYAHWTDITAPSAPIITRDDYNTFSWTATDNEAVTHYAVTNSATAPTSGWISGGATGSYDISSANTWYVWVKDAAGNTNKASITSYQVNRTQGTGTTLTTKYESSTGTEFTEATVYVLNETKIYISVTASTGYSAAITVNGSAFTSGNTRTISATTNIASVGTALPAYFNSGWKNLLETDVNGAATGITKETIKTIEFATAMPTDESYNANNYILVGATGRNSTTVNSSVIAYYYKDGDNLYHLAIVSPTGSEIYAPTSCTYLFNGCSELTEIGFNNFSTAGVKNMNLMFYNNKLLTSVGDISNWDVSSVTTMNLMFNSCSVLGALNLSNWNVSKVENMSGMFSGCSDLTSVGDISNWKVSSVTTMRTMFQACSELTSLDLSGWDVSSVTDMGWMFNNSPKLMSLGDLSGWDVSSVTDIGKMFQFCPELTSLDLSGWELSAVTNTADVFTGCNKLVEIKAPKSIAAGKTLSLPTGKSWYVTTDTSAAVTVIGNDTTPATLGKTLKVGVVVTFNANGGTVSPTSAVVFNGESITLPTATRTGYSINGWYTAATGGTKVGNAGATYTTSTAKTLYAQWTDITAPSAPIITRDDYNIFSWTATDNKAVTHYAVTNSATAPTSGWTSGGATGSYTISASAKTWYVWVKDAAGNTNKASIASYQVTRTQGANTTLTTKYESSSGTAFTSTPVYVLSGTPIYIAATASTGYTLSSLTVNGSAFTSGNTHTVTAATAIASSATDTAKPTVSVSRTDYNTFSWTASDNAGVAGYAITNSSTAPTSWTTTGTLTSGSYDISATANTWYVWVKDAAGNTNKASIASYQVTRTQGTGTTLTTKYTNSSGSSFTSTTYVLSGTPIYIEVSANAGYHGATIKVNNTAFTSRNTHTVSAATAIVSSATVNTYYVAFNSNDPTPNAGSLVVGSMSNQTFTYGTAQNLTANAYSLPGYTFTGWNTAANGSGTAYANSASVNNLTTTNGATVTLYAQWVLDVAESYLNSTWQTLMGTNVDGATTDITINNIKSIEFVRVVPTDESYVANQYCLIGAGSATATDPNNSVIGYYYIDENNLYHLAIVAPSGGAIYAPQNAIGLFTDASAIYVNTINCAQLTSLIFSDVFNTSTANSMNGWFAGLTGLTSLDVSNFNTSAVTDMGYMFRRCQNLTSLNVSSFNTSSVTDMRYMFHGCTNLTSLNVSNFNTSSVTNMTSMFHACSNITSLDLSGFDVSKVTTIKEFLYGTGITVLDLSSWHLSSLIATEDEYTLPGGLKEIVTPASVNSGKGFYLPDTNVRAWVTNDPTWGVVLLYGGGRTNATRLYLGIRVEYKCGYTGGGTTAVTDQRFGYRLGEGDIKKAEFALASPGSTLDSGHSFAGWYNEYMDGTKVGDAGTIVTATSNRVYYSYWEPNKYTVTLNPTGGTGGTSSTTVTYGEDMPYVAQPKKPGYTFDGYYYCYEGNGLQLWYDGIYNSYFGGSTNTSTTIWKDLVGSNDGLLKNFGSSAWADRGLVFDGTNDFVVSESNMTISNTTTWELVFKADVASNFLIDQRIDNVGYQPAYLGNGNIQFYDSTTANSEYITTDISAGNLYTLTIVKNGTTVSIYVNGELKGTKATNITSDTLSSLFLGTRHTQTGFFKGTMYGLRIYNTAITEREIAANYSRDRSRFMGASSPFIQHYDEDGYSTLFWQYPRDATLYAKWTVNTYKVTWKANGGNVSPTSATVTYDSTYTIPTPTRTGYTFLGWNGKNLLDLSKTTRTPSYTTLTNSHTLTFNVAVTVSGVANTINGFKVQKWKDGSYVDQIFSTTTLGKGAYSFTKDSTFNQLQIAVNGSKQDSVYVVDVSHLTNGETYVFSYSLDAFNGSACTATVSNLMIEKGSSATPFELYYITSSSKVTTAADHTMIAHWAPNTYTITFDQQGGSGGTASTTATYAAALPAITVPTRTGYTFGGYYTATGGSGTQYYTAAGVSAKNWNQTAADTLYAKWTANTYTVSFNANGGSGGQSANVTATYGSAMPSISTTKPTQTGYTFGGWYDTSDATGGTQYYTAAGASARAWDKAANTTLYARWIPNSYTVTFKINSSTNYSNVSIAINGETTSLTEGQSYTFTLYLNDEIKVSATCKGSQSSTSTSGTTTTTRYGFKIDGKTTVNLSTSAATKTITWTYDGTSTSYTMEAHTTSSGGLTPIIPEQPLL